MELSPDINTGPPLQDNSNQNLELSPKSLDSSLQDLDDSRLRSDGNAPDGESD